MTEIPSPKRAPVRQGQIAKRARFEHVRLGRRVSSIRALVFCSLFRISCFGFRVWFLKSSSQAARSLRMYALAALCAFGVTLAAEEASKPAVVQIGADERVVHVVGTPFNHVYYEPRLEALLLQRYACRGLVFREVAAGISLADLLKDLEGRVMIHRPTLVIIQAGNDDLNSQYRRVTFDFAVYRPPVEEMVRKLRAANVKVILCSVIPRGADGPKGRLNPPNDGLKTWVDAARDIAAKHDAVFVDLFTEAVDWPMINTPKTHYDPEHHRRSWELFARQVHFDPAPGSRVEVDAQGAPPKCQGATVSDLKTDGGLSLILQNA
ncbi:MAG: hypothetical protein FJ278_16680, partial [Planctomycetes bacterium]|nr:hypothetical protein [Planctomycetota bacterium]